MALVLTDYSTNSNDLTNSGATEVTASLPFAQSISAVALAAASTQYLYATDHSSLKPTTAWTIEAWVKFLGTATYDYAIFQTGEITAGGHFGGILLRAAGGTAGKVQIVTGDDNSTDYALEANTAINNGAWHHVAVTYNASGTPTFKIYLDGSSTADRSGNGGTPIYPATNYVRIGCATTNGGARSMYFDGQIDDVRLWNTERSGAEIAANYNIRLTGSETGLVAYWPFDAGSISAVPSGAFFFL